jgi:hypothetical protein
MAGTLTWAIIIALLIMWAGNWPNLPKPDNSMTFKVKIS